MQLVYVDEAGISNPQQEPFTVVAAVVVHGDEALNATEEMIRNVVKRHVPAEQQEGFVLHATDLFGMSGKTFGAEANGWTLQRRLAFADDIAAIPAAAGLRIAIGDVERGAGPFLRRGESLKPAEITADCLVTAYAICMMRVERWMRDKSGYENCLVVVENNDQMRRFISEVHRYFQSADSVANWTQEEIAREAIVFPFQRIREDPLFISKRHGCCLEIADFCAYVAKRCRAAPADPKYARFLEPWKDCVI